MSDFSFLFFFALLRLHMTKSLAAEMKISQLSLSSFVASCILCISWAPCDIGLSEGRGKWMGNCLRPQWFWYMIMLQASNHRNCLGKPSTTHPFSKQFMEA